MDFPPILRRRCPGLRRRRRPHLPIEIISIILSTLPVDSVVRFRYVSKIWHELISDDPVFIKRHLGRAPLQIMRHSMSKLDNAFDDGQLSSTAQFDLITVAAADDDDDTMRRRESLSITYYRGGGTGGGPPVDNASFLTCDGLLYFYPSVRLRDCPDPVPFRMPDIIPPPYPSPAGAVCNPLLGELIFLPYSHKKSMGCVCGFFFHASSNQYRLLRVTPWPPHIEPPPPYFEYEILALGWPEEEEEEGSSSSWRSIPCSTSQCPALYKQPVILDNDLHWMSISTGDPVIMVFNKDIEDFRSIQLPQGTVPKYAFNSEIIEMDGCLCLFQFSKLSQMEMWLLLNPKHHTKEGGWQKMYDIPMERIGVSLPWPRSHLPMCVLRDEIVFHQPDRGLIYYNHKLGSVRTVPLCRSFGVSLYRKSLVSLLALNKKSRNHFITSTVSRVMESLS